MKILRYTQENTKLNKKASVKPLSELCEHGCRESKRKRKRRKRSTDTEEDVVEEAVHVMKRHNEDIMRTLPPENTSSTPSTLLIVTLTWRNEVAARQTSPRAPIGSVAPSTNMKHRPEHQ